MVSTSLLERMCFYSAFNQQQLKKKKVVQSIADKTQDICIPEWIFLLFICLSAVRSSLFEKKCVCRYEAIINSVVFKSITKEMKLKLPN